MKGDFVENGCEAIASWEVPILFEEEVRKPMTELSWLLDLLLSHKLSKYTKDHITKRIMEVGTKLNQPTTNVVMNPYMAPIHTPSAQIIHGAPQSPSTIAAMQRHAMVEKPQGLVSPIAMEMGAVAPTAPIEPGIAAATPATQAAMAQREESIRLGQVGKPAPGRTSPRKF